MSVHPLEDPLEERLVGAGGSSPGLSTGGSLQNAGWYYSSTDGLTNAFSRMLVFTASVFVVADCSAGHPADAAVVESARVMRSSLPCNDRSLPPPPSTQVIAEFAACDAPSSDVSIGCGERQRRLSTR